MSTNPLAEAVEQILADHCSDERVAAADGRLDPELWRVLDDAGFTTVGVPEEAGGSGGELADAAVVLSACGRRAAPVPVAESVAGGLFVAASGLPRPDGAVLACRGTLRLEGTRVRGTLRRAPVHGIGTLAAVATDGEREHVVLLPLAGLDVTPGRNLAGEPRSTVAVDVEPLGVGAVPGGADDDLRRRLDLLRAVLVAGAAQGALDRTVRHVGERVQFGRPLARFQAVQQDLALMAGEVAAARAAVDGAVAGRARAFAVAAALVQAARTAEFVAARAHQLHGAIGTTHEHGLRLHTTRLWSWPAEWGGEAAGARELAAAATETGGAGLWALLTTT
jgi:acyl-CoA dehydrogenase